MEGPLMDNEQRRTLLRIAREAIAADLMGHEPPPLGTLRIDYPNFGGAFVSLHKGRSLRGCIGTFYPQKPLPETVQSMAVEAAHDPRFFSQRLTPIDLPDLDIEISVLSPMERTSDPLSLQLGVHGIYVRQGYRAGCFLPQVATEYGQWTKEEFLGRCCRDKAGLSADAWRDPETEVYLFTAEIFSERQMTTPPT
jgi:AmmeMemoRadiSam system protein A